jgi:hypothetical protein
VSFAVTGSRKRNVSEGVIKRVITDAAISPVGVDNCSRSRFFERISVDGVALFRETV